MQVQREALRRRAGLRHGQHGRGADLGAVLGVAARLQRLLEPDHQGLEDDGPRWAGQADSGPAQELFPPHRYGNYQISDFLTWSLTALEQTQSKIYIHYELLEETYIDESPTRRYDASVSAGGHRGGAR